MLAPCYFCRRCLAARLSFFSPSRGAHPQRTISAPASLPVLNRAHCFFSTVASHERGRIIICISTLPPRVRPEVEGRTDPLPMYRPRRSRGDPRGDRFPSREGNRIGGYFPRARKGDFERFGWRREEREGRDAVVRRVSTRNGS